jgi:hypothetical protein
VHKFVLAFAGVPALLPACLMASSPLSAGPLKWTPTAEVRQVDERLKVAENVVCYGFGWRGWGIYAGWFRPACSGAWVAPAYVVPAPVYAPAYVGSVHPAANPCWIPSGPDGRPGHWAAC